MKKQILFVDDEQYVLQGLHRTTRPFRNEWQVFFANSGQEALELLGRCHIDIIVADMRMPEMTGAELLNKVRELYPGIVRIIFSGFSDEKMILQAVDCAHQFILKPCDIEVLKKTVDRAFVLQRLLKNEELLSVITRIKTLPSLPSLYAELLAEINSSNPSITRITEIITRDVTMIARVLQFVNSAFFSLPKKVTEVKRAVALLGINTIKALALYTQVFSSYKTLEHRGLSLGTLWEHSQEVGILAGKLINYMWPDKKLEESAIIIGVLHDLGKIPLLELPEYYTQLKLLQEKRGCSSVEGEYCLINTSHAEVGAYLLGLWGLPDSIIEPIAFHHYPSRIGDQEFSILSAVHIAEGLLDGRNESSSQLLDATGIENLDRQYIVDLKLIPYISEWKNICKKYRERSR